MRAREREPGRAESIASPAASHAPTLARCHARSLPRSLARDPAALFGATIVVLFLAAGLLADWLAPYDYAAQDLDRRLEPPGLEHLLGTDHLGRDVLSRLVYGARISLSVGVLASGLAVLLGLPIGAAAGYLGGWVDLGAMWVMDLLLAFPGLLLAIAVASALGPSVANAMLAIAVVSVPNYARLVRSAVLAARGLEYVQAGRALGASTLRVMLRHILPAVLPVVIVRATLGLGAAILAEAGLSFIGLGAQPPDPSWGGMLSSGRDYLARAPHLATLPGLCIMATVLAFNLLGDALRDALDPRLRR